MYTKSLQGLKSKKTQMSKKTKGRITAFLILFFLLVIFWFSFFIDYWLAKTSFGKSLGFNLHRFSTLISLLTFSFLCIFSCFIVCLIRKKRRSGEK